MSTDNNFQPFTRSLIPDLNYLFHGRQNHPMDTQKEHGRVMVTDLIISYTFSGPHFWVQ